MGVPGLWFVANRSHAISWSHTHLANANASARLAPARGLRPFLPFRRLMLASLESPLPCLALSDLTVDDTEVLPSRLI